MRSILAQKRNGSFLFPWGAGFLCGHGGRERMSYSVWAATPGAQERLQREPALAAVEWAAPRVPAAENPARHIVREGKSLLCAA